MMTIQQAVHVLHGFLAGLVAMLWSIWLALFLYVQFVLYEMVEETKVRDEMYRELKEWAMGFATAVSLMLFLIFL